MEKTRKENRLVGLDVQYTLANKLFTTSVRSDRCPNLKIDEISPYCAKDLGKDQEISLERRTICDPASLQLWCTAGEERYTKCIWYKGEPFTQ